jgi:hypothetical protein
LLEISLEIICIAKTCKRSNLVVSGPGGLTARSGGLTVRSPESKFSGGPGGLTARSGGLTVSSPERSFLVGAGGLTARSPLF